jgi:hypothetical protein
MGSCRYNRERGAGWHRPWQLKWRGYLLQHGTPTDLCRRAVETLYECPVIDALDPDKPCMRALPKGWVGWRADVGDGSRQGPLCAQS